MIPPAGLPNTISDAGQGAGRTGDFGWRSPSQRIPMPVASPMGRMMAMNTGGIEPGALPGAGGGGGYHAGAGEPGGLGGPPIGGNPFEGSVAGGSPGGVATGIMPPLGGNPFGGARAGGSNGSLPGEGYGWRFVGGPGQVFGNAQPNGTQLAYPTGSYWDPQLGWVARGQAAGGFNNAPSQAFANELALAGLGGNTSNLQGQGLYI